MRHLAMTGMDTAAMISRMILGEAMRATPPSARICAGTRSRAMTATAPACSAMVACAGVVTSMMTPPLSISARPVLRRSEVLFPLLVDMCEPFGLSALNSQPSAKPFSLTRRMGRDDAAALLSFYRAFTIRGTPRGVSLELLGSAGNVQDQRGQSDEGPEGDRDVAFHPADAGRAVHIFRVFVGQINAERD